MGDPDDRVATLGRETVKSCPFRSDDDGNGLGEQVEPEQ